VYDVEELVFGAVAFFLVFSLLIQVETFSFGETDEAVGWLWNHGSFVCRDKTLRTVTYMNLVRVKKPAVFPIVPAVYFALLLKAATSVGQNSCFANIK
jgi:hypothetical protein